jgi:hypothetical protein
MYIAPNILICKTKGIGHFLVSPYLNPHWPPWTSDVISVLRDLVATEPNAQRPLEAIGGEVDFSQFLQTKCSIWLFSTKRPTAKRGRLRTKFLSHVPICPRTDLNTIQGRSIRSDSKESTKRWEIGIERDQSLSPEGTFWIWKFGVPQELLVWGFFHCLRCYSDYFSCQFYQFDCILCSQ